MCARNVLLDGADPRMGARPGIQGIGLELHANAPDVERVTQQ
jgi:hypothetical protein